MFIKYGQDDKANKAKQYFVSIKEPRVFTVFIRSNFFVGIFKLGNKSIEDALFTNMSIFPNFTLI